MEIKQKIIFYSLCIFSIYVGFYFNENSSGGAFFDYNFLIPFTLNFSENFEQGLIYFLSNSSTLLHSPVFYILIGSFIKISKSLYFTKLLYIFLCSFLPFIFYKILISKYKADNQIIFFFSLVIFLSPYFRSSAIWLLGDNLSLIFLGLSIYYFNKSKKLNSVSFKEPFLCLLFLILCCYIRYYYCLFSLYYLFFFFQRFHRNNFILLILISLILALPALFYFYYIFLNFDFASTVTRVSQFNIYNNSLVILSILLFYLFPFCFLRKKSLFNYLKQNKKLPFLIFVIIFTLYLIARSFFEDSIIFSSRGGGIFMKIAHLVKIEPLLFLSISSFFSLIILDFFFKEKRFQNYSFLIILIFSFPLYIIYQKYFDPLFYLFFFGLVQSSEIEKTFSKGKNFLLIVGLYFSFFFLFSLIYYSKGFHFL